MSSTSRINLAVEAVMDLIDAMDLFALITRGALGTDNGLACEVGPTTPETIYLDKHQYIPIDLTINGKHDDLELLTDTMNLIHENLTMRRSYPYGNGWEITDITTLTEPQIVEREDSNQWMMASALLVKMETLTPTVIPPPYPPEPTEEEPEEPEGNTDGE